MSLSSQPLDTIPAETARVAWAAFLHSTRFMQMRDALGTIYDHPAFEALYPQRVAYLSYADNVSRLLPNPLSDGNQPVIRSGNPFSRPHRSRLACL